MIKGAYIQDKQSVSTAVFPGKEDEEARETPDVHISVAQEGRELGSFREKE